MLRGIPGIISPDLMKYMMEMGHSDVLVLADANFPAISNAKRYLKADGVEIPDLLDAILTYFPLDGYVKKPVKLMRNLPGEPLPEIWESYKSIIEKRDREQAFKDFGLSDRLPFYEETRNAYLVVQTVTTARYANISLQKGVI